jgi:hypothetical protein
MGGIFYAYLLIMIIIIKYGGFMKFRVRNLRFKLVVSFLLFTSHYLLFTVSYAAHPLITDDTGTQGKGKFALEVNSEFSREKESVDGITVKETGSEVAAVVSYGFIDNADIVLGIPYQWKKTKEDGEVTSDEDGIGDMSVEIKWRFFEKGGLGFALKPGVTLPTGDEGKGLGNGKASYSLMLITTKEIEPWAFHLNIGYMHNEYKLEEDEDTNRKDLWHASLASAVEVVKDIQFVTNIGVEKNPDKESNTHPAFVLGGVIYSMNENFDIDAGVKIGLNKPETDLTFLAGMAMRF